MPVTPPTITGHHVTGRSIKNNQKKALSTGSESDLRTGLEQSVSFVCTEHACRERIVGHVLTAVEHTHLRVLAQPTAYASP
jgi:hypothetical protein